LAIFATVDSISHLRTDHPIPNIYHCGREFYKLPEVEQNEDLFVVFEYGHCTVATSQTIIREITDHIPKKHRAGGQSSGRFDRLRLEAQHNFNKKVKKYLDTLSFSKLFVGGPGLNRGIWENKHICPTLYVVGCQYNGFSGIRELKQKFNSDH